MKQKADTIVITGTDAYGDTITSIGVIKAIYENQDLQDMRIKVKTSKGFIFQSLLKKYGGPIDQLVDLDYQPQENEVVINLSEYLDRNPNIFGVNYLETMTLEAEEQIKQKLGKNVFLRKDIDPKINFEIVKEYQEEIEIGKERIKQLQQEFGNKPIIWLGTCTVGSKNRMPQSYEPHKDFWKELVNRLKPKFILYELRAPDTPPICEGVQPLQGRDLSFIANSEIIKASIAGIGLDAMHIEWAYALGNKKIIILLGPTHPNSITYPNARKTMLTIPDLKEFENQRNFCCGCGNLGYSSFRGLNEIKELMKQRFSDFEFDKETREAFTRKDIEALKNTQIKCRKIKIGEDLYDCLRELSVQKVI